MSEKPGAPGPVWKGRPSIGSHVALYGILALLAIVILDGLEVWTSSHVAFLSGIFSAPIRTGSIDIPYGAEVATAAVVLVVYLAKVLGLVIFRERNSYELLSDGLYINKGIANLQNTFVSAMAFSDAKLIRTLGMRIMGRSLIVVEANDGRRFEIKMIKNGANVQALIRANLSHPTVRVEK
jgi:hypothetical protein